MKTIEEKIIDELGYNKESYEAYAAQEDIVAAIHKAQKYEQERCINAAQEIVCQMCYEESVIGCRHANDVANCCKLIELRKAIEKGE